MDKPKITADRLNAHLENGGSVVVASYTRATIYKPRNAGCFLNDSNGNILVRRGRSRECLTWGGGAHLLCAIRLV